MEPGKLAGLSVAQTRGGQTVERILRAGAFGRGLCGGIETEPCLENWVGLEERREKRKRDGGCILGEGNDKLKGLEGKKYTLCLGNKIRSNPIRVVRSYERKLGLTGRSLNSKQWNLDFTRKTTPS